MAGMAYGQTVLARAVRAAGLDWDSREAHSAVYDTERTAQLFCIIANAPRFDRIAGCLPHALGHAASTSISPAPPYAVSLRSAGEPARDRLRLWRLLIRLERPHDPVKATAIQAASSKNTDKLNLPIKDTRIRRR
jgi:hypothetical protein